MGREGRGREEGRGVRDVEVGSMLSEDRLVG